MPRRKSIEEYSAYELQELLKEKRLAEHEARLEAYRKSGRVLDGVKPATRASTPGMAESTSEELSPLRERVVSRRRRTLDAFLLVVEVIAIAGLVFLFVSGANLLRTLNEETASALVQPTLTPTPLISAVVLPGGHLAPISGQENQFNEAEIPEHLRPLMQSYANLPIPTQSPQQARQIQIPAIGVNAPIVMGDGWEQLKKGVGQHLGTANPGDAGNLVLSAHNDIFSEIFRDLDQLKTGDEIVIITQDRSFTYVVTGTQVVEPDRVDLLAATSNSTITLISCYPYRVDDQRIIVQGVLQ
jgi:sortase A